MILIADFEGKRCEALASLLEKRLRDDVTCIHSARDLIRGVKFQQMALMILNPKLPDLGSKCFDLIKKIRTHYNELILPIVLLGDKEWQVITVNGINAGANDVLHLPLDEHVTLARLRRLLACRALYLAATAQRSTHELEGPMAPLPSNISLIEPERDLDKPIPCELPLSLVSRSRSFFCKTIWLSYRRLLLRAYEDVPREGNYKLEIPNPAGGKIDLEVTQLSREANERNVAGVFKMGLEISKMGEGYRELFESILQQHEIQETISSPLPNLGERPSAPVVFSSQDMALGLIEGSRYKFGRLLGRGSFASVYLVDDLALKRPVAMKILAPDFSRAAQARQSFLNEAQIAAQFHHPNIVFVFEVGEILENNYARHLDFPDELLKRHPQRIIYFTMQHVEGQTLGRWIGGHQQPEGACLEILVKIARALVFAHQKDVIHRDIKPDNIMITPEEEVLVADFGIATLIKGKEDKEGKFEVACTPKYASPEQLTGEAVDMRSDIYSFGIVAYELLTGQAPFTGRSITEIAHKQLAQRATPVAEIRPGVSPDLVKIINRCIEKAPEARYQKTQELLSDLLAFKGTKEKVDNGSASDALDILIAQAIVVTNAVEAGQVLERILAFISLRQTHEDVDELRAIHQKLTDPNLINILIEKNLNEDNLQLLYQYFTTVESSGAVSRILRWYQKETAARRKEFLGQLAVLCAGEEMMPLVAYGLELSDADARILLKAFGETAGHTGQPIFLKWALHTGYQTQRELLKIITTTKRTDFEVFGILEYYASGKGTIHRDIKEMAARLLEEKQMF